VKTRGKRASHPGAGDGATARVRRRRKRKASILLFPRFRKAAGPGDPFVREKGRAMVHSKVHSGSYHFEGGGGELLEGSAPAGKFPKKPLPAPRGSEQSPPEGLRMAASSWLRRRQKGGAGKDTALTGSVPEIEVACRDPRRGPSAGEEPDKDGPPERDQLSPPERCLQARGQVIDLDCGHRKLVCARGPVEGKGSWASSAKNGPLADGSPHLEKKYSINWQESGIAGNAGLKRRGFRTKEVLFERRARDCTVRGGKKKKKSVSYIRKTPFGPRPRFQPPQKTAAR